MMQIKNLISKVFNNKAELFLGVFLLMIFIAYLATNPISEKRAKDILFDSSKIEIQGSDTIYVKLKDFKGELKSALEVYEINHGYEVIVTD